MRRREHHGLSYSTEYATWLNIIARCERPSCRRFKYYGGRGIEVCPEWRNSFERFFADMGPKPSPELSIDRIDVNGNYEPGNCRWATALEQRKNQRRTLISFDGQQMSLTAWANHLGIARASLQWRLKSWPIDLALTKIRKAA